MLREYGEEPRWKAIARRIVDARPVATTTALAALVPPRRGPRRSHPATRTFQALRIAVNDELRACEAAVPAAVAALRPGGRLAVLTFHSLEDRIVKWALRRAAGAVEDEAAAALRRRGVDAPAAAAAADVSLVTRKPLVATEAELAANPRARSAKLRVVQRL